MNITAVVLGVIFGAADDIIRSAPWRRDSRQQSWKGALIKLAVLGMMIISELVLIKIAEARMTSSSDSDMTFVLLLGFRFVMGTFLGKAIAVIISLAAKKRENR
ncbi:hypothetical protein [Kandleria sp.]|uniref:hypothetical protein n=1 Tax=Kandleria sp. TaxID=2774291 RepID=UPI001B65815C|nr:hypothetical protein [Kandleria sp.]MBP3276020.1 hypothetical protein [Kandleria sp.]